MKIREILREGDHGFDPKLADDAHLQAIKGGISMPDISMNKSNGSPYQQYRFGLGLAVADGRGTYDMPESGAFAGDPFLSTYTDEEFDMIKDAAEITGAGRVKQVTRNKSEEPQYVNKSSPVKDRGHVQLKKKKR